MATILIIDDEESIRHLLREVLEKAGHKVLEASNGREGLEVYQKHPADLVIMDLLMPDTDGLETTLQLTREYVDAKVIAITGDHSTPASMAAHSWHPVPLLIWGDHVRVDDVTRFGLHRKHIRRKAGMPDLMTWLKSFPQGQHTYFFDAEGDGHLWIYWKEQHG